MEHHPFTWISALGLHGAWEHLAASVLVAVLLLVFAFKIRGSLANTDAALTARDRRGVRAGRRPALAEDRVRRLRRVAAQREPETEQVAQRGRDDVGRGFLRRGTDDRACGAAPWRCGCTGWA